MVRTVKPWGYEDLLECNEHYVVKVLHMKKGHCCSLQYHNEKHETVYVLKGVLRIVFGDPNDLNEITLEPGDYYVIEPKKIHRMCADVDGWYLEASTNQLDDVVRIEDNYGRV